DTQASREVDRLKAELDGMRDLVNKLTVSLAQQNNNGATAQQQQPTVHTVPPQSYYDMNAYNRLENELEKLRRELVDKEFRERERELERRQKEAENANVKDIRPELVQMSDPDSANNLPNPVAPPPPALGSEYITLADGVFYSTKDKQVYVMTPASKAAATPTPAAAPAKRKVVVRTAPKRAARPAAKRKAPAKRRPSSGRRPPTRRGPRR
ncbi:MAG: hypothetical protein K2M48_00965, partial [Clostridiales bacterium]|nr:hypothetical protein [Clostridiales bacterium]